MSHCWVLGLHHRDFKGILLPLEIASDLQRDTMCVLLTCLPLTHQTLATDASGITASTGQLLYLVGQVTQLLQFWRRVKRALKKNTHKKYPRNQKPARES